MPDVKKLKMMSRITATKEAELGKRYAHLAAEHLAPYADRLCALRVVDGTANDTNTAHA